MYMKYTYEIRKVTVVAMVNAMEHYILSRGVQWRVKWFQRICKDNKYKLAFYPNTLDGVAFFINCVSQLDKKYIDNVKFTFAPLTTSQLIHCIRMGSLLILLFIVFGVWYLKQYIVYLSLNKFRRMELVFLMCWKLYCIF